MSETVAQRILDSQAKLREARRMRSGLSELYGELRAAIWSELKTGTDIDLFRRNLQREHANRLAGALLRPAAADAGRRAQPAACRREALRRDLAAAQGRAAISPEAKAHLAETIAMLDEALKAPLVRQGV